MPAPLIPIFIPIVPFPFSSVFLMLSFSPSLNSLLLFYFYCHAFPLLIPFFIPFHSFPFHSLFFFLYLFTSLPPLFSKLILFLPLFLFPFIHHIITPIPYFRPFYPLCSFLLSTPFFISFLSSLLFILSFSFFPFLSPLILLRPRPLQLPYTFLVCLFPPRRLEQLLFACKLKHNKCRGRSATVTFLEMFLRDSSSGPMVGWAECVFKCACVW